MNAEEPGNQQDRPIDTGGGDFVGGDKIGGDKIAGDKVMGNKITQFFFGDMDAERARQAERNRKAMLQRVQDSWIKGVLEQSLYQVARIELGLQEQPGAVERPWAMIVQELGQPARELPQDARMSEVFDELGRSLLVLGAPGTGKTTLLLELASDLLNRAERDPDHRIPAVFHLSAWALRRRPLAEWLMDELNERYSVPKKVARAWVEEEAILPLLDGLDEVTEEHRTACAEAINAYRQEHGLVPMAVCSRTEEYEALGTRLRLQGAIAIDPLTHGQVDAYLERAGEALDGVREAVAEDATLYELLDTPLVLSVVTMACKGEPASSLGAIGAGAEWQERLFGVYVDAMYKRRGVELLHTRMQTERWLAWLASQMRRHKQSVLLLEWMQPDWLSRRWQQRLVLWGAKILSGLTGALVGALVFGLVGGPIFGLVVGLVVGLGQGGIWLGANRSIEPAETLYLSWVATRRGLIEGLGVGLILGLWFGVIFGSAGGPGFGLWVGLVGGLIGGLYIIIYTGLVIGEMTNRGAPNEGMHHSARSALVSGLGFGVAGGLASGLFVGLASNLVDMLGDGLYNGLFVGLLVGLIGGVIGGLEKGGRACFRHLTLRYLLVSNDFAPWRYAQFLNYATERIFLRKVGGGYIFVHRLLQDYFAELWEREHGEIDDSDLLPRW
jgi:hypothetical protein